MKTIIFIIILFFTKISLFSSDFGDVKISDALYHDFTKLVINDGKSDVSIPLLISKKEFENIIDKSNFEIDTNFSYLASNYLRKTNNNCYKLRISGEFGNWWHGFDLNDPPQDSCNLFWVFCDTNNYFGLSCNNIYKFPKVFKNSNLHYCFIPIFIKDKLVSINFVIVFDNFKVDYSIIDFVNKMIVNSRKYLELGLSKHWKSNDSDNYYTFKENSFQRYQVPMNEFKLVELSTKLLTCYMYELNYVPKLQTGKEANKK